MNRERFFVLTAACIAGWLILVRLPHVPATTPVGAWTPWTWVFVVVGFVVVGLTGWWIVTAAKIVWRDLHR